MRQTEENQTQYSVKYNQLKSIKNNNKYWASGLVTGSKRDTIYQSFGTLIFSSSERSEQK